MCILLDIYIRMLLNSFKCNYKFYEDDNLNAL